MSESGDKIEELILSGALEVSGIDIDTGEMLYNFTDKLRDINPELFKDMSDYISRETMALWVDGFLDIDVTEKNPLVTLTEKAFDEKEIKKLSKEKEYTLREIIRIVNLDR
jgi:energy-converting hydrogenase Eha subunit G